LVPGIFIFMATRLRRTLLLYNISELSTANTLTGKFGLNHILANTQYLTP